MDEAARDTLLQPADTMLANWPVVRLPDDEAEALAGSAFSVGHIAIGVALAYLDYEKKEAGVAKVIYPSGDMKKDMQEIKLNHLKWKSQKLYSLMVLGKLIGKLWLRQKILVLRKAVN